MPTRLRAANIEAGIAALAQRIADDPSGEGLAPRSIMRAWRSMHRWSHTRYSSGHDCSTSILRSCRDDATLLPERIVNEMTSEQRGRYAALMHAVTSQPGVRA